MKQTVGQPRHSGLADGALKVRVYTTLVEVRGSQQRSQPCSTRHSISRTRYTYDPTERSQYTASVKAPQHRQDRGKWHYGRNRVRVRHL